jgi:hypothetical protein
MSTIQVNLSFSQIKEALQQLSPQKKIELWRLLDDGLDRTAIARKFDSALKAIRNAYSYVSEDEVTAEAVSAVRESRKARYAKSRP